MPRNNVDSVTNQQPIVKARNKLELLINQWLDSWSVIAVVADGDRSEKVLSWFEYISIKSKITF